MVVLLLVIIVMCGQQSTAVMAAADAEIFVVLNWRTGREQSRSRRESID